MLNKNYFTKLIGSIIFAPIISAVIVIVACVIAIIGVATGVILPIAGLFGKVQFNVKEPNGKRKWVKIGDHSIAEITRR